MGLPNLWTRISAVERFMVIYVVCMYIIKGTGPDICASHDRWGTYLADCISSNWPRCANSRHSQVSFFSCQAVRLTGTEPVY